MRKLALLVAAVPLVFAPAARTDDNRPQPEPQPVSTACTQPVPERRYTDDTLIYLLSVDLTACDRWDGSPIQLEASLERVDGTEGHGAWSGALCAADFTAPPHTGDASSTQATARSKSGTCDVHVAIDHPAVEAAYYRGEVSFPWDGARRTLSFTALCGQAPDALTCRSTRFQRWRTSAAWLSVTTTAPQLTSRKRRRSGKRTRRPPRGPS